MTFRWWYAPFAVLAPITFLLGIAEIGMRIAGAGEEYPGDDLMVVRSDDAVLIYQYRPSHRVSHDGVEYRTNSAGFRDREFSEKAPGTFRIIVVGDSVVFGYRERVQDAYPQLLEKRLAQRAGPPIEVFNMGVAGYNSLQEVELIKAWALEYEPDLLILGYVHNDNKEDGGDGGLSRYFNRSSSRVWDWLRVRTRRLARRIGRDVTTEAFDELALLTAEHDLPVVVVIFPELRFRDEIWSHPDRHRAVRRLAEQRGFEVLDLLDPFVQAGFEALMLDNIHPNARGYELAARSLHAFLEEGGRLPPVD